MLAAAALAIVPSHRFDNFTQASNVTVRRSLDAVSTSPVNAMPVSTLSVELFGVRVFRHHHVCSGLGHLQVLISAISGRFHGLSGLDVLSLGETCAAFMRPLGFGQSDLARPQFVVFPTSSCFSSNSTEVSMRNSVLFAGVSPVNVSFGGSDGTNSYQGKCATRLCAAFLFCADGFPPYSVQ